MTTKKSRTARLVEITQVVSFLASPSEGLTSYQVAFWVGMKPSSHFNALLSSASELGWIKWKFVKHRKGVEKRIFRSTSKGRKVANHNLGDGKFWWANVQN